MKEHIPQQKHEAKGDQSVFKMRGSSPGEPFPACTCTRLFREAGFGEVEMKVFPASEKLYVGTRSIV